MATVSKSFTAVGVSDTLIVRGRQNVTFSLSGTYAGQFVVEKATTPSEMAWTPVSQTYSTANATVSLVVQAEDGDRFRVRCLAYTSGTAVTTIADENEVQKSFFDTLGALWAELKETVFNIKRSVSIDGSLTVTGDITGPVETTQVNDGPLAGMRNVVINGAMMVSQRGTSFTSTGSANSDDTYNLDRWTLLSDGNDIVDVTQEATTVPTGGLNALALDVETANKKFGVLQVIEQKNCIGLIGNTVTLSFKARKGASNATVGTMRAVILAWSGTADTVTSDIVSAWGASGTNPTLAANWTAENTATDLTLTTSYQTFSVTAAVDTASAKNIGIFLYYNNADGTVQDFIYVTDVQLEIGSQATPFERRPYGLELSLCERYYGEFTNATSAWSLSSTDIAVSQRWPVRMRAAPSLTLLDSSIVWDDYNASDTSSGSTIVSSQNVTPEGAIFRIGGFAGHTQSMPGNFNQSTSVFSASAEL